MTKKVGEIDTIFTDCPVPYPDPNSGSGSFGAGADGLPGPTNGGQIKDPVQFADVEGGDRGKRSKSPVDGADSY